MDLFAILSILWIPCLSIAAILQIRAIYIKRILVRKYKFEFPKKFLGILRFDELQGNYRSTDSVALKGILSKLIAAKKWSYILVAVAIITYVAPILLKFWLK